MRLTAIALALCLALSGCATIRRHPIITGVVVGLVAGSIALSADHGGSDDPTRAVPVTRRK